RLLMPGATLVGDVAAPLPVSATVDVRRVDGVAEAEERLDGLGVRAVLRVPGPAFARSRVVDDAGLRGLGVMGDDAGRVLVRVPVAEARVDQAVDRVMPQRGQGRA